jgi:hypothetical protein
MTVEDDLAYWKALSDRLGWSILGFTYRTSVTYISSDIEIITMTAAQRDDIVNALIDADFKVLAGRHRNG